MKPHLTPRCGQFFVLITACGTVALSAQTERSGAASGPPEPSEIVQLPQFQVEETQGNSYRPVDALSVNRVASSILNSPFSVNVLTPEFISDIGANSMLDATRYMPGISAGRGAGTGGVEDRTDYRGFESFGKTIDNFSGVLLPIGNGFMAQFDPDFIDRIELVMGPDSILAPTGSPGGSANIITKSPNFQPQASLKLEAGNYNAQKLVLDSTGPIGKDKHWAYRVIGSFQDTKTYMPGNVHQANASGQLEYAFSPTARILVKYFMEKWQLNGTPAANADNGEIVYAPNTVNGATLSNTPQPGFAYNGWGGNAPWNYRFDTLHITEVIFQSALGSNVTMRLGGDVLFDNYSPRIAFPRNAPAETFDPVTGQETGVTPINLASVATSVSYTNQESRQIQMQNDFAGSFHPGPVSLQPVIGWATQQGRFARLFQINDTNLPAANFVGNPTGYYSPPAPPLSAFNTFTSNHPAVASLVQAYALVRVGLVKDHIFLTGGVSRTWASVNDYSFKGLFLPGIGQVGAAPGTANYTQVFTFQNTGNAVAPSQNDYHDTHMVGVVVRPLENVSLYASDSTNAGIASATPLWQAGTQYEFGLKAEFFNQRLQFTFAHYQIKESNVSANNPLFSRGLSSVPNILLNETNHGVEFSVVGGITRDLSVIATYTSMHLREPFGRRLVNVPDTIGNLFLNYHVATGGLKNLNVFAGANHVGNEAGETVTAFTPLGVPEQPGFYVAAYTVYNAGVGYTWGHYHFVLNVDNVLDSKFWWEPAGRISVAPYPGIGVRFTTTIKL